MKKVFFAALASFAMLAGASSVYAGCPMNNGKVIDKLMEQFHQGNKKGSFESDKGSEYHFEVNKIPAHHIELEKADAKKHEQCAWHIIDKKSGQVEGKVVKK